jgi:P-type Cu2+ transporter
MARDTARPRPAAVACAHCALPVPAGFLRPTGEPSYCCRGCATAAALIREAGLDQYYRLPEGRDRPVSITGKRYDEYDHEAFQRLYVQSRADGSAQIELLLEGVHCRSCLWLVERVPLLLPGVLRAELEVGRSVAHVTWDPAATSLSAIARTLDTLGYPSHPFRGIAAERVRRDEQRRMLTDLAIAGAIAMNVMLIALAMYSGWFGAVEPEYERYFRWISLLLTIPAVVGPGRVFFRAAWAGLRLRRLQMDLPVALALAAGLARGAVNTWTGVGPIYFDGVATLIFLLLMGRYLQLRSQRAAVDATELTASLAPRTARIVEGDGVREVPTEAVLPAMLLDVRAGEAFSADGVVETGVSSLDLALLTGESRPVAVASGDAVYAGTTNLSAPLRVRVTAAGEATRLGAILRRMEESARRRAPIVQLADRMAGRFVALVITAAALTWWYWISRDPLQALDHAIALLIVTCPCALALATPLAITVATGRAARRGILIKGGDALEALATPGRIWLDKTGTITQGQARLVHFRGDPAVKPLVLALERRSTHPLALAFTRAWPDLHAPEPELVEQVAGRGIRGMVGGRTVVVGSPEFVRTSLRVAPAEPPAADDTLTPVWIAVDGALAATAGIGDPIAVGAREAIRDLQQRGWRVGILSGDDQRTVAAVARAVGVAPDEAIGAATPESKLTTVERSLRDGRVVMVGDGVNDAAALAAATVGVSVHGGAEASLAAADVYLARPGLGPLVQLVDGVGRTMTLLKRNLLFSALYNVFGAGLCAAGLIDPLLAAVVMPISSIIVIATSYRSDTFADPA